MPWVIKYSALNILTIITQTERLLLRKVNITKPLELSSLPSAALCNFLQPEVFKDPLLKPCSQDHCQRWQSISTYLFSNLVRIKPMLPPQIYTGIIRGFLFSSHPFCFPSPSDLLSLGLALQAVLMACKRKLTSLKNF